MVICALDCVNCKNVKLITIILHVHLKIIHFWLNSINEINFWNNWWNKWNIVHKSRNEWGTNKC